MKFKSFTRQHPQPQQQDIPEAADSRLGARSTPTHYSGSPSPDTDTRLAPDNPGSAASWVGVDTHEKERPWTVGRVPAVRRG